MSEQLTRVHYRYRVGGRDLAMLCSIGGTPRRTTTDWTQVTCLRCLRRFHTLTMRIRKEPGKDPQ